MGTDAQLGKGVLEGCVLRLLKGDFRYAGDIVAAMREAGFDFSEGTLYPMLLRLEKDGCFVVAREPNPSGPPKKYYKLSARGLDRLKEFENAWKKMADSVNNIFEEGEHA